MRARWKAALVVAGVFLAGAGTGSAVTVKLTTRRLASYFEGDNRKVLPRLYGEEIDRRLHLTAAQRAEIERIVDDDWEDRARINQTIYPQMAEMRRHRHERIRAILTPEQAPTFDAMASEYEQRRRRDIGLPP
jgi:hypothetical protein